MEKPQNILVVEDDADIRNALRLVLQRAGFQVITASNGREGLERLGQGPTCLVLLDLMMPVMDGWEFREKMLCEEQWRDIPVLLLSAYGTLPDEASSLQVQGFIPKPFSIRDVVEQVRKTVDCAA